MVRILGLGMEVLGGGCAKLGRLGCQELGLCKRVLAGGRVKVGAVLGALGLVQSEGLAGAESGRGWMGVRDEVGERELGIRLTPGMFVAPGYRVYRFRRG